MFGGIDAPTILSKEDAPVLVVPGWGGSGPAHWQTAWEAELGAARVALPDWCDPNLESWVTALDAALASLARRDPRPPVLVAHSLGCVVIAHWACRARRSIRAALFVAPADVERAPSLVRLRSFGPIPDRRLPFDSLVVTSDDDVHVALDRAQLFATQWGSDFHVIAGGGHLNAESGLGRWTDGLQLLDQLLLRSHSSRAG